MIPHEGSSLEHFDDLLNLPAYMPAQCAGDRSLNTAITWARSPEEAIQQAKEGQKMLFVVHVSGNFEEAKFT